MAKTPKPRRRGNPDQWGGIKTALDGCDRKGLVGLVKDLYEANPVNRRFLHARFGANAGALDAYRHLVREAVFPDPMRNKPTRLRDANAAIAEYKRSTGDIAGTVDLMLEFVEAGTGLAAETGYGDDAFFSALERKVNDVVRSLDELSGAARDALIDRLVELGTYQGELGWGYGDFLGDVAATVQARRAK